MKTRAFFTIVFLAVVVIFGSREAKASYLHGADFYYFYDELDAYGSWIELNDGLLVWRPYKSFTWQPYRRGSWIWTDAGWYWDSYEAFGHIVYHYGRWFYDDYYGWLWVPDYEWAPAWVSWRYDDEYIGWAPLPPYAVFSRGRGISFTVNFTFGYRHWHFVRYRNFCDPYVYNYYLPYSHKQGIFNRTRYRDDYRYDGGRIVNNGIGRDEFERRGGLTLRERKLVVSSDGGGRGSIRKSDTRIEVYTPDDENRNRGTRDVVIERGLKATEMDGGKVTIGERRRNLDNNRIRVDDSRNAGERSRITDTDEDNKRGIIRNNIGSGERGGDDTDKGRGTGNNLNRNGGAHSSDTGNESGRKDPAPRYEERKRLVGDNPRREPVVKDERRTTDSDNGRGRNNGGADERRRDNANNNRSDENKRRNTGDR